MTIKYKCLYEITGRIEDVSTFLVPLRELPKEPETQHWSDCAVHSEPAYPKGECDCGGYKPEQEPVAKAMTAHRAAYFMERFKHEEKLLGPNEQAALDFVISMLEAQPEQEPVAWLQIGVGPLHDGDVIARTTKPKEWNPEWWKFEPLYTTPPQRKPLTWAQKLKLVSRYQEGELDEYELIEMVEAAHGIKE
jgi:hypothetical protein